MNQIIQSFKQSPVIPVLTFNDVNASLEISRILIENGLTNLEITLRTPNALKCIHALIKEFPSVNIGVGTVVNKEQLSQALDVGSKFAVSPGFTKSLVEEAQRLNLPYLPGASTPSEIIELLELGIDFQKFFHAKNSGGFAMLKAYEKIFTDVKFCPTGGIIENDFVDYLALDNVVCIGGSWMISNEDIQSKNYNKIKNISKLLLK